MYEFFYGATYFLCAFTFIMCLVELHDDLED